LSFFVISGPGSGSGDFAERHFGSGSKSICAPALRFPGPRKETNMSEQKQNGRPEDAETAVEDSVASSTTAPLSAGAELLKAAEDLPSDEDQRMEEQAASALEFLRRYYPDRLAPAQQMLSPGSTGLAPTGIQFQVPPAHFAAAVVAVHLPTSDAAILREPKGNAKRKPSKGADGLHKCKLVLGRDRIRFVNARNGVQCEYQLPIEAAPTGISEGPISFEVPVFHFEGLFANAVSLVRGGKRQRLELGSDPVTFTYDAARETLHIQADGAHLQIQAEACAVPPVLPVIPKDCMVHGRSVATTLDRALAHAGTFSSLSSGDKSLKVVSFSDGVVRGGAHAAASYAESPLLKGLDLKLDRAVVNNARSILRRLKAIQLTSTDDQWIVGDSGFTAAVNLVEHEFPKLKWFEHFLTAPRHWTMKMEDLLFAALSLDCLQARDSDRNPTLATLSIIDRDNVPHLKIAAVAPGGIGDAVVEVQIVEHGAPAPSPMGQSVPTVPRAESAAERVAVDIFAPEATVRLAYVLRALKLVDGQQQVDLFMRQGMAMLRTEVDDLTMAHALSATGRHRSR
jgi:hypothetical protein